MAKLKKEWKPKSGHFDGRHSTLFTTLESGYVLEMTLVRNSHGVLICTELNINYPEEEGIPVHAINSRFFQTLGFGDLLTEARKAYIEWGDVVSEVNEEMQVDELLADWTQLGPSGFSDEKYAAVAWKYEKFILLGLENPVSGLAEFMHCDKPTASGRIMEARKRNLLTKPKQGTFGGRLTSKGRNALGMKGVLNAKKK